MGARVEKSEAWWSGLAALVLLLLFLRLLVSFH
jgi:hypothetical protein